MPVRYRRSEVLTSETELALGVCWLPGIAMSCQDLSGNGLHVWGSARLHINNGCVVKQHRQGVIREKQRRLCEQIENQPLPAGKPRWKRKTSAKFSGELWIFFFFFFYQESKRCLWSTCLSSEIPSLEHWVLRWLQPIVAAHAVWVQSSSDRSTAQGTRRSCCSSGSQNHSNISAVGSS